MLLRTQFDGGLRLQGYQHGSHRARRQAALAGGAGEGLGGDRHHAPAAAGVAHHHHATPRAPARAAPPERATSMSVRKTGARSGSDASASSTAAKPRWPRLTTSLSTWAKLIRCVSMMAGCPRRQAAVYGVQAIAHHRLRIRRLHGLEPAVPLEIDAPRLRDPRPLAVGVLPAAGPSHRPAEVRDSAAPACPG